jgi:hypothetical protein
LEKIFELIRAQLKVAPRQMPEFSQGCTQRIAASVAIFTIFNNQSFSAAFDPFPAYLFQAGSLMPGKHH